MKKAFQWSISLIGILFLIFCSGLLVGRRTNIVTPNPPESNVTFPTFGIASDSGNEQKLNINTATVAELQLLPGIGQKLAERIVAYRTEHGPFQSILDLKKIEGIGEGKLNEILEIIYVEDNP